MRLHHDHLFPIEHLDDAQKEAYITRYRELIVFAGKKMDEAHALALRYALKTRPPIELLAGDGDYVN
jgi:hypothetical protein